jgi:hypothetical protein
MSKGAADRWGGGGQSLTCMGYAAYDEEGMHIMKGHMPVGQRWLCRRNTYRIVMEECSAPGGNACSIASPRPNAWWI